LSHEYPHHARLWLSFGHALKTAGHTARAIEAYRRAATLGPAFGDAWWSLANLKTFRFTDADIATLREQLARNDSARDIACTSTSRSARRWRMRRNTRPRSNTIAAAMRSASR
jgi:uncharacterized membrane protein YccC